MREITDARGAELYHEPPDPVNEREWQARLTRLEQLVCELLIENQRLRMSIASTESSLEEETGGCDVQKSNQVTQRE
jgi:hypothetical protein